jgi:hypothetical protein
MGPSSCFPPVRILSLFVVMLPTFYLGQKITYAKLYTALMCREQGAPVGRDDQKTRPHKVIERVIRNQAV